MKKYLLGLVIFQIGAFLVLSLYYKIEAAIGFGTLINGLIATYVGYQQYRTNQNQLATHIQKVRLDLYDRRYEVYNALREYLSTVIEKGDTNYDAQKKFLYSTTQSVFLFGQEVVDYLNGVYEKSNKLHSYNRSIDQAWLRDDQKDQVSDKRNILYREFIQELDNSKNVFIPYLSLKNI